MNSIPISEKYALTISESAIYFGIGEKKLRRIAEENPNSEFVLQNGTHCLIKRKKFENYLDSITSI